MSATKKRNSWWVDITHQGKRYRKKSPVNSKAGAKEYELRLQTKLMRGESIDPPVQKLEITFKKFSGEWHEMHVMTNTKPSVQRGYRMTLDRHLIPFFGKKKLDEISGPLIERYKALKMKESLCNKTINNHLAVVKSCLTKAGDWGHLEITPKFVWLKVPPQKFDFLTPEESSALLEGARQGSYGLMVLFALRTGMRMGELLAIKWEDIDFDSRTVTVSRNIVRGIIGSTKNNKIRHVPLADDLMAELRRADYKTGFILSPEKDKPSTRGMVHRALKTACRRSKLRHIGWHVLRHTFASQLAMKSVSIRAVQEMLGHADITMTMRYSHLSPSALHDAVAVLEQGEIEATKKLGQHAGNAPEISPKRQ